MASQYALREPEEPVLRVVLVGKTGVGKSAAGNIILRKKVFKSTVSSSSLTTKCQKEPGVFEGQILAVIDTPGLFETNKTEQEAIEEITRSISLSAPGPHVILVVLQAGRFTKEEKETVKILQEMFGEKSADYMMVLFTQGDNLEEEEGLTIETVIGQNINLSDFVSQCHGGYHVFNNKNNEDPSQVRELLQKINEMIERNGGSCYNNEMFKEAERAIQEEIERLLRENPIMKHEEARRQAESDRFIKAVLATAAVGAVFVAGALIIGSPVGVVVGAAGGAAGKAAVGAVSVAVKKKQLCVIQ